MFARSPTAARTGAGAGREAVGSSGSRSRRGRGEGSHPQALPVLEAQVTDCCHQFSHPRVGSDELNFAGDILSSCLLHILQQGQETQLRQILSSILPIPLPPPPLPPPLLLPARLAACGRDCHQLPERRHANSVKAFSQC
eukprot:765966-Hanusia_phi.AAC.16